MGLTKGRAENLHPKARSHAVCALAVLALVGSKATAAPVWDALLETTAAAQPEDQRRRHLDQGIQMITVMHERLTLDASLAATLHRVGTSLKDFDADALYELLPETKPGSPWRGLCVAGQVERGGFLLKERPLPIPAAAPPKLGMPWDASESKGTSSLTVGARPVTDDTYEVAVRGHLNANDFVPHRAALALGRWLQAELTSSAQLPAAARHAMMRLGSETPALADIVSSYATLAPVKGGAGRELLLSLDRAALARDYPEIGRVVDRAQGMLILNGTLATASGRALINYTFDTGDYSLKLAVAERLDVPNEALSNTVDLHANVDGLHIDIEGLTQFFSWQEKEQAFAVAMATEPRRIQVGGYVLGFVPVWFIDALIPADMRTMIQDFIAVMAKGPSGKGSALQLGPRQGAYELALSTAMEANGLIAFAMEVQEMLGITNEAFLHEAKRLEERVFHAALADYRALRSAHAVAHH